MQLNIKTNLSHVPGTFPFYSSRKTVQQVVVETYLLYRKMFNEGMLTRKDYFSVIRCINR